ncbi:nucleotide sugar dehydrogenase [Agromyces sp. 3263]|uniref:nucleotide sugar dehydrogenase n=1 Tax=Agromyces sp. 3263 TaxID=2817750 RepID=UPI00285F1BF3|nr:nucleotide sugar dehydrogenase [Agromyces sp. 3263]MDR6904802.1 nucleotide sugar dehydrogenase [Agromyces sp. 3263]
MGQGYVGLPVAMRAVEVGYSVVGIDLDERRVDHLRRGASYVDDVPNDVLRRTLETGRYLPTTDYDDATGFDVAVITVPTPLRENLPDLTFIESAAQSLAKRMKRGATVILESTTYPGTTEELLTPALEDATGYVAGLDFHVGYSPERIDPGNPTWGFVNTPKVISGINPASLERVAAFYDSLVDRTVAVGTPKEAELTKLLENTFRHVNIALVNELAIYAHQLGVDIWESIEAASTKPFGYMKFTPGPGVGGHCLPVDPSYLSWEVQRKLGQNFRFVELANDVNRRMPHHVVQRTIEMLNDRSLAVRGSRVLILGIAYKRNTGDIREAPALRVIELLQSLGADVVAVDSHVEPHRWPKGVERQELDGALQGGVDAIILVTDHDDLDLTLLSDTDGIPILDTKNRLDRRVASPL